jgi:pimeloyl-ACP methyl ester carboxylesterase
MTEFTHRLVQTNGIRMHLAEAGEGFPVVMCHGFPELWYSWRHQLRALAAAGFHAIAPDQRGYGETEAPEPIEAYTQRQLVADIVGMLDALGIEKCVIVGHDWGGAVAWNAAMMAPDRIERVIGVNTPLFPRAPMKPTDLLKAIARGNFHYMLYFQEPGVAEVELERDVRRSLRGFYQEPREFASALGIGAAPGIWGPAGGASSIACRTVRTGRFSRMKISRSLREPSRRPASAADSTGTAISIAIGRRARGWSIA